MDCGAVPSRKLNILWSRPATKEMPMAALLLCFELRWGHKKISHKNFEQTVLVGESLSTKIEAIQVCHALLQNPKFLISSSAHWQAAP